MTLAWQCITSERAGAFSVMLPNWSTAVLWQPACRMKDTPWRPYCITHRSPMTCQGLSPGVGEAKGDLHWQQGLVEEALCSAPWTPLTHHRACRAWPTLQRGKYLTPLFSILTNPIMLLTYVRLLCDFCIVWISKCHETFCLLLAVNRCLSRQWIFNSSRRVVVAQNMSRMLKLESVATDCVASRLRGWGAECLNHNQLL